MIILTFCKLTFLTAKSPPSYGSNFCVSESILVTHTPIMTGASVISTEISLLVGVTDQVQ